MITTYFKNMIMGNVFKSKTDPSLPNTYYLGLSSTAPTVSGTNATEPFISGNGYARVALDANNLSAPSNGVVKNKAIVSFDESLADWFPAGTPATHYVVYDSATGGNLLMYNQLKAPRVIESGTIVSIKVNGFSLQLTV